MTPSWYMHLHVHTCTHGCHGELWRYGRAGCSVPSELCDRELEASGALGQESCSLPLAAASTDVFVQERSDVKE